MSMQPMAMYGIEVPCGDVAISARPDIPSAFRITMAAIDPSAEPEGEEGALPRATLKVIRQSIFEDEDDYDEDDDSDDGFDTEEMERILAGEAGDDSSEDDEEMNGGPSDPAKSKKAKEAAAERKIKKLLAQDGMDIDGSDSDEQPNGVNGINGVSKSAKSKGKMPASDSDEDEDEDEDDSDLDDDETEVEEFVICTLDPSKLYQQPLDITFGEDERVWFKVSGTHSIFLTGNYVEPTGGAPGMYDPDSDDEEDYDLEPDMDELDDEDLSEGDELDDMEDPRFTEIDEDEEAPVLIKAKSKAEAKAAKANKNKRPAPESADEDEAGAGAEGLDAMIAKEATAAAQPTINGEATLTKKQLKKLKKNDGAAAAAPATAKVDETVVEPPSSQKSDKKVQFAKELEQGPTPTKGPDSAKTKAAPALGPKVVQGVTIDDKKVGSGQSAKSGDRVGMRYIGKLKDGGKVFDSNKKGKPFTFKLGAGEVIKGWEIGVKGMQVGGERRITIPAHLAYGSKNMGDIPPNSTLVFDIKVLELK